MKTLTQSRQRVIMWNKVKYFSQERKYSARKIARVLGLVPRTVRSYLSMSEQEFYTSISERPRQYERRLDAYYDFVKKLLNMDLELTAAAIEDRLKENFEDLPQVSSKTVYFFAILLSRSRYKYVRFQERSFTGKDAVECHDMAFSYFQRIPQKLLYDQDRVFLLNENIANYSFFNLYVFFLLMV